MNILYKMLKWVQETTITNDRSISSPFVKYKTIITEYYVPTWFGKLFGLESHQKQYIKGPNDIHWYNMKTNKSVSLFKQEELRDRIVSLEAQGELFK